MTSQNIIQKTEEEWKEQLTDEQYRICRQKGTEAPFSGEYYDSHQAGIYECVCCGQELFDADQKFDSGSGWPSFSLPVTSNCIQEEEDVSHGMRRTEVLCSRCGAHLGHVFPDGPGPSHLRYCINSVALQLDDEPSA